jgi:hypothetical protein
MPYWLIIPVALILAMAVMGIMVLKDEKYGEDGW